MFCSGLCNPEQCHTRSGTVLCTPDGTWSMLPLFLGKLLSAAERVQQYKNNQPLPNVVNLGTGQLKRGATSPNSGVIKDNPAFQRNLQLVVTLERGLLSMY